MDKQLHTITCGTCSSDDFTYSGELTDSTPIFCGACGKLFGAHGVIRKAMETPITNPLRKDFGKDLRGATFNLRRG